MQDFRKLKVWQKVHQMTVRVYGATRSFPKEELYGLTSQTRRAAASIPTNIAEGCGRGGNRELLHFLRIACGSSTELEYHLLLAHELKLLDVAIYQQLNRDICEVKRMLTALIRTIRRTNDPQPSPTEN